jgi:ZIP family zinc transporter
MNPLSATTYWTPWLTPLLYSFLAGISTGIGGMVVFLFGEMPSDTHMAFSLCLAAGVMLTVTMMDIVLPALFEGSKSECVLVTLSFAAGVALFQIITLCPPWVEALFTSPAVRFKASDSDEHEDRSPSGFFGIVVPTGTPPRPKRMIRSKSEPFVVRKKSKPAELNRPLSRSPSVPAFPTFKKHWLGRRFLTFKLATHLLSENFGQKKEAEQAPGLNKSEERKRKEALRVSILLAVVLTLHNLPEGLAVAISASESSEVGFTVMVAIALHNIPEGICVAAKAFESTGDKWQAVRISLYSGLSEPFGAIIAIFLFGDKLAAAGNYIMAQVGGMMCAVTFFELIPDACRYRCPLSSMSGFACGTAVMIGTITVLDS